MTFLDRYFVMPKTPQSCEIIRTFSFNLIALSHVSLYVSQRRAPREPLKKHQRRFPTFSHLLQQFAVL